MFCSRSLVGPFFSCGEQALFGGNIPLIFLTFIEIEKLLRHSGDAVESGHPAGCRRVKRIVPFRPLSPE
jgi:hypothetical protein